MAEIIDKEAEQLEKLNAFRKIAQSILRKWLPLLAVLFLAASGAVEYFVQRSILNSPRRFMSETKLIFTPKSLAKFKTMEEKELLSVVVRYTTFKKYADMMNMNEEERLRAAKDIEVTNDRAQKNIITVTAYGPDEKTAIARANSFAELCIREYSAYRVNDLESWVKTLSLRKQEIQDLLDKTDNAEAELCRKYGVTSPGAEADRLARALNERNREYSELKVQVGAAEMKRRKYENDLAQLPTNAIAQVNNIRHRAERVAKLEEELSVLEAQYTEKNPRLSTRKAQVEAEKKAYKEFLDSVGAGDIPMERFLALDTIKEELKESIAKDELLKEQLAAIERERERLNQQVESLLTVAPEFDRVKHQRDNYRSSLETVDDEISNVRYLITGVANDLSRIDPAQKALGTSPWSKTGIAVAIFAGLVIAGLVGIILVLWELASGHLRNSAEIALHKETSLLGGLPKGDRYSSEKERKAVTDSIYYRFHSLFEDPGVIFLARLAGGEWNKAVRESFIWNFAMSGVQLLGIELVDADNFTEPKDARILGGTYIADGKACFPVADVGAMSPSEIELLKTDVAELRKEGSAVFIYRDEPFKRAELVLEQMFRVADTVMFVAGVRRTRRSLFGRLLDLERKNPERRVPVVATGLVDRKDFKEANFR